MFRTFLKLVFPCLGVLMIVSGCNKQSTLDDSQVPPTPPKADFTFVVGQQTTVTFANLSTDASSYSWEFGDGTTSTEKSPLKVYNTWGSYKVKLTATGNGTSNTIEKTVLIPKYFTTCVLKEVTMNGYGQYDFYDGGSEADVYIIIDDGVNTLSSRSTPYYDIPWISQRSWTLTNKFSITPLSKTIRIGFWDADDPGDPDDLIYQFDFVPEDYTTGPFAFSSVIHVGYATLDLEWE